MGLQGYVGPKPLMDIFNITSHHCHAHCHHIMFSLYMLANKHIS